MAIEQITTAAEQRARLIVSAKVARNEMIETGKGFDADEVHAFLKAKVSATKMSKPKVCAWRT